ncbi:hypothetical protein AB0M91_24860 [Micromonospora rifamycinica]|uniref:hypothetical protein n=1 Tax=Micromonospora rifamycinica TaxID=291594 RepID=UPI003444CF8E
MTDNIDWMIFALEPLPSGHAPPPLFVDKRSASHDPRTATTRAMLQVRHSPAWRTLRATKRKPSHGTSGDVSW